MVRPRIVVALVVAGLFLIILIQNTQVVTFRLLFWKIAISQIILVPLTMVIGFLLGYIVAKTIGNPHKRELVNKNSTT